MKEKVNFVVDGINSQSCQELNLLGVACPMNFVKTKLFVDKLDSGSVVKVYLDPGEPVESVTNSMRAEGHEIVDTVLAGDGTFCVIIRKL